MSDADVRDALSVDPLMATLVAEHGTVALEPAPDAFERLLTSIVRQQVSMDAAAAILDRLHDRVEPTPQGVLAADPDVLREVGLSNAKVEYARGLAEAWLENGWSREHFASMTDDEVLEELTSVRGIGVWTGKMFLMFGLGREDVFPVEDLGIRKAMWQLVDEDLSRPEMVDRATSWAPYRSYASRYLWRSIE